MFSMDQVQIAVLIPSYNEELTVSKVVNNFRTVLPNARLYVYDNNSTDQTVRVAREAGAIIRSESRQGKGYVVNRMFADIEADVYVLVDGDDTYDAASAVGMIETLLAGRYDMVVASRCAGDGDCYRTGHRFGNRLLTHVVSVIFGKCLKDMLSGYRVFSRRFVKTFPYVVSGFEIETALTIHALDARMPIFEMDSPYSPRPAGSTSKLRTSRDGIKIFETILNLFKEEKPLTFFGIICIILFLSSLFLGFPVFLEFVATGLVPRLPTAVLASGIMTLSFFSLMVGLILNTVTRGRQEAKRLHYLGQSFLRYPNSNQ